MHPLVYAPDDMMIRVSHLCFMSSLIDTKRTVKIKNKDSVQWIIMKYINIEMI